MCNHVPVCLPGAMDRRREKGARRKGTTGGSEDVTLKCRFSRSYGGSWLWHTWECFIMLSALSWYRLPWLAAVPLVLWMLPKKSKSDGCLWRMVLSIPLWAIRPRFFPTNLFLNGPTVLVGAAPEMLPTARALPGYPAPQGHQQRGVPGTPTCLVHLPKKGNTGLLVQLSRVRAWLVGKAFPKVWEMLLLHPVLLDLYQDW